MRRKREPGWWQVYSRAITDLAGDIAGAVDDPEGKPSLDDQFRDLWAVVDAFEMMCRERASAPPITPPGEADIP